MRRRSAAPGPGGSSTRAGPGGSSSTNRAADRHGRRVRRPLRSPVRGLTECRVRLRLLRLLLRQLRSGRIVAALLLLRRRVLLLLLWRILLLLLWRILRVAPLLLRATVRLRAAVRLRLLLLRL